MSANGGKQQNIQPIDGNKRKIENLRIENLMRKTEEASVIDCCLDTIFKLVLYSVYINF